MTYQVLARKWRPRDFASLVGQEHVVRALTHALEAQRLHHAYLFTGTRGVGKTTLSRILAKALNCEPGITATPCGVCNACREIDEGRFVDYVEMDAASNRGVDEMAALLERAVYAPVDARFKVYMIDEVHMLTNHAFNSMLKTLEEPPPHVKFILATTDPQKIPVTVLSRCLQFNLKQMPPAHIVSHLEHILGDEQIAFDAQALRLLARAAEGSMRDALSLTDQAIAYSAGHVTEEAVRGMLGALDQSYLIRLLDAVTVHDGAGVLAIADEMASRSLSFSTALQDLSGLLHRIAWGQFAPGSVLDEWPEADAIRRFAAVLSPEAVQLYYQIATIGRGELGLAPDEYAGFTMTLLRMLAFRVAQNGAAASIAGDAGGGVGGMGGTGGAPTVKVPAVTASPAMSSAAAPSAVTMPETGVRTPHARASVAAAASAQDPFAESTSTEDPFAVSAPVSASATARAATNANANAGAGAALIAAPVEHAGAQAAARNTPSRSGGPASAALNVLRGAGNRVSADKGRRPAMPVRARVEAGSAAETQPLATTAPAAAARAIAAVGTAATVATAPTGGSHAGHAAASLRAPHVRNATPNATGAPNADPVPWDARWDDVPPDDAYMPLSAYDDDPSSTGPDERPLRSAPRSESTVLSHSADVHNRPPPSGNPSGNRANALAGTTSAPAETAPLPPAVSLAPLGFDHDWPALAASLSLTGVAYQLAFNSELTACEGRQLSLRVSVPQYAEATQVARLKDALDARLGHPVELKVEIGAARRTAAAVEAAARRLRQQEAEQEIRQAPFVQSLIRDFDATIVPDSIRPLPNGIAASTRSNP